MEWLALILLQFWIVRACVLAFWLGHAWTIGSGYAESDDCYREKSFK